MSTIPREPEAFGELLARRFKRIVGPRPVETIGPLDLSVDGHTVELDDLHRASLNTEVNAEADAMVERFIDAQLAAWRIEQTPLPFDLVETKILPVISSFDQIRKHPEEHLAASLPYHTFVDR